jgi:hypothetical protein
VARPDLAPTLVAEMDLAGVGFLVFLEVAALGLIGLRYHPASGW